MKTIYPYLFVLSFIISIPTTTYAQCPHPDYDALVALYNSTDGPNWTNTWDLNDCDVCNWHGIACLGGNVSLINLKANKLAGVLPVEIGNLTSLTNLNLAFNDLTGEIPSEIGNLIILRKLEIKSNKLTGEIPSEIGNLTDLIILDLSVNQLSGEIPSEIGNLSSLGGLNLNGNQLTEALPPELGNLSNLLVLELANIQSTGTIPPELGNLTSLKVLNLSFNDLIGNIPPEIGNMTSLTKLNLAFNELTGAIPSELGNLENLIKLELQFNELTGKLPAELENLSNVELVLLYINNISGEIPPQIGSLTSLTNLGLFGNELVGKIPPEIGNLQNLQILDLRNNQLSGNIPPEFGNLNNISVIETYDNLLEECIPSELTSLCGKIIRLFHPSGSIFNQFCLDGSYTCDNCEYTGTPDQLDSDCDNIVDECDVCPGADDSVNANNDEDPDCLTPPDFDDIEDSWKCGKNKVIITHIPPDNPNNIRELCVSYNSVPTHLAEGSFLGPISACDQVGARTLPTQRQASFISTELTTFPNPAHDLINITWTSNKSEMVKLNIIGINGQLINRTEKNTHPGINSIKEDISQLENGIYFIKMNAPSHSEIIKFIKT